MVSSDSQLKLATPSALVTPVAGMIGIPASHVGVNSHPDAGVVQRARQRAEPEEPRRLRARPVDGRRGARGVEQQRQRGWLVVSGKAAQACYLALQGVGREQAQAVWNRNRPVVGLGITVRPAQHGPGGGPADQGSVAVGPHRLHPGDAGAAERSSSAT